MEIVPALPEDEPAIVALFAHYRFALQQRSWLAWKYHDNPFGGTRSFKILHDGQLAGAVALLPQDYWWQGRRVTGIQAVDGLMGAAIRGRGLFNDVMDFLLRQAPPDPQVPHFFLSFPSLAASVKAHAHAGWRRLGAFELHTCLVCPQAVGRLPGMGWLPPLMQPFWRAGRAFLESRAGRRVSLEPIARFAEGQERFCARDRVHGDRTAAFLNWRVIDNPRDDMHAFAVRDEGEPAGLIVAKRVDRALEVVDLRLTRPRPHYLAALLRHVGETGLADSVDVALLPGHPLRRVLPLAGFFRRGERGVVFVQHTGPAGLPDDPRLWDISPLDSDW